MIKEKINNSNLQRLIALKCNKLDFEDVTDEEIEKIQEITLQGKLINGRLSGIDLEIIRLFPNLVRLVISDYEITQQFVQDIKELEQLKFLEIIRCSFDEIDFSGIEECIKDVRIIGCKDFKIKYPKVKKINIIGSDIDFNNIDFSNVEEVYIKESNIKNAHDLIDFKNIKRVCIDGSVLYDANGEIMKDIKVCPETQYSHIAEVLAIDTIGE